MNNAYKQEHELHKLHVSEIKKKKEVSYKILLSFFF